MISEDKRPNEFAIGVKQILGLLPTAQNRLGSAILIDNYGGSQVSVTRLALEKTIEIISLSWHFVLTSSIKSLEKRDIY